MERPWAGTQDTSTASGGAEIRKGRGKSGADKESTTYSCSLPWAVSKNSAETNVSGDIKVKKGGNWIWVERQCGQTSQPTVFNYSPLLLCHILQFLVLWTVLVRTPRLRPYLVCHFHSITHMSVWPAPCILLHSYSKYGNILLII